MDVQAVNATIKNAIRHFEADEHEDMQAEMVSEDVDEVAALMEQYVGVGGSIPPDHAPVGDPLHGAPGGVDNLESPAEFYMSYVSDCANDIAAQCDVPVDDAMDALIKVADQLVADGTLPEMPDAATSSSEDLSTWTGAAKTCDLTMRTVEYVKSEQGQSPVHATSSDVTA